MQPPIQPHHFFQPFGYNPPIHDNIHSPPSLGCWIGGKWARFMYSVPTIFPGPLPMPFPTQNNMQENMQSTCGMHTPYHTGITAEGTRRNEGTRLNVTVASIEEVSRTTLVEMSKEDLEEMLKNNKEITIHLPPEWTNEQRQKAIEGFTAMQNENSSVNGFSPLGRNAPLHEIECEFWNKQIRCCLCPRCGKSISEVGSSRIIHYKKYHFPTYFSYFKTINEKEPIDHWLSTELGDRSSERRACQICDGTEEILFRGRLNLLIHIKKDHEQHFAEMKETYRREFKYNSQKIKSRIHYMLSKTQVDGVPSSHPLQPQRKDSTSEEKLTTHIEIDSPPLKWKDPLDQKDIDFISLNDKMDRCPRCSRSGFSHSTRAAHYRSSHFGVYFNMEMIPLSKYEKWLSIRLGPEKEGISRECPHCIKPIFRFFGRLELLKHINKNHIAVFFDMERDYLNEFWNEKPVNEEIHRILVDCSLASEWTKRN